MLLMMWTGVVPRAVDDVEMSVGVILVVGVVVVVVVRVVGVVYAVVM